MGLGYAVGAAVTRTGRRPIGNPVQSGVIRCSERRLLGKLNEGLMASNGKTLVIDGDGHVMEPPTLWAERMDHKKWGDLIPHLVSEEEGLFIGKTCRGG